MKPPATSPSGTGNLRSERYLAAVAAALFTLSAQRLPATVVALLWARERLSWNGDFVLCLLPILCALALWFRVRLAIPLTCLYLGGIVLYETIAFASLPIRAAAAYLWPQIVLYLLLLAALSYVLASSRTDPPAATADFVR